MKDQLSNLPFDISRCIGIDNKILCNSCRRKEPGHSSYQSYFSAPDFNENNCKYYIPKYEKGK